MVKIGVASQAILYPELTLLYIQFASDHVFLQQILLPESWPGTPVH